MTDLHYLNMMLGPASQQISQNMQFLRDIKQNGFPQPSYPTMPNNGSNTLPPGTMPVDQAMYVQNMMGQMHQMMMTLHQMAGIFQVMQNAGINFRDAGLNDSQVSFLQSVIPGLAGGSAESGGKPNAALSYLSQFLKKEGHEANTADADNDGNVVGAGDLEQLKAAIEENAFTKADLVKAFQYLVIKADSSQVDELMDLFGLCEKAGLVNIRDLYKPKLVEKLSDERSLFLAKHLAGQGMADSTGAPNTSLANFLMDSLESDASEKFSQFGKSVVKELVSKWMPNTDTPVPPQKEQLTYFLRMINFRFKPDGTLEPDAQQPFAVGTGV